MGGDPQVRTLDSSLSVLRGYGGRQEKGGGGRGPSASEIIQGCLAEPEAMNAGHRIRPIGNCHNSRE